MEPSPSTKVEVVKAWPRWPPHFHPQPLDMSTTNTSAAVDDIHSTIHENSEDMETDDEDDEITDDKQWTTGDFAIVSADNVRFRIDRHYLMSAR